MRAHIEEAASRAWRDWGSKSDPCLEGFFTALIAELARVVYPSPASIVLVVWGQRGRESVIGSGDLARLPAPMLGALCEEALSKATSARAMDHCIDPSAMFVPSIRSSVIIPVSELKNLTAMRCAVAVGLSESRAVTGELFTQLKELGLELNRWFARYSPLITLMRDQKIERIRRRDEAREAALFIHDARAPIGALKLLLETMPGAVEEVTHVRAEIEYLDTLFDGFAATARGQSKMKGQQTTKLSDALARVAYRFASKAKHQGVCFVVPQLPSEWAVSIDPLDLERALTNLISNALQHTPKGSVSVNVAAERESILISVSDTGSGMSDELVAKIVGGRDKAVPSERGWGVGLLSVKQAIEAAGGTFGVVSELGRGTVIDARLRRAPDLHVHSSETIGSLSSPAQTRMSAPLTNKQAQESPCAIVLVDDDVDQLSSLARALSIFEQSVVCLTSVEAAIQHVRGGGAKAVVCDANMPDGGALALLRALNGLTRQLPVAVLTGEQDQTLAYKCAALGAVAMFTKPANVEALASWCKEAARVEVLEAAA